MSTLDITLLHELFPSDLMDHFHLSGFQNLCNTQARTEYWLLDFMASSLIQDFPLRGKAVFM